MPVEVNQKPRLLRIVSGTVEQVEDWIDAHSGTYVVQSFTWSAVGDHHIVGIVAILRTEAERIMRMMALMQQGQQPFGRPF